MKCIICKHTEVQSGTTTVTLERESSTFVYRHVPAKICPNCGEAYVDAETSKQLLENAAEAAERGVQVGIREYKAA